MKKPSFKLRNISRHPDGKVYAALTQEGIGDKCDCAHPDSHRILMIGPIEDVLNHAAAQGFVVDNVEMQPMPVNAVLPEANPDA